MSPKFPVPTPLTCYRLCLQERLVTLPRNFPARREDLLEEQHLPRRRVVSWLRAGASSGTRAQDLDRLEGHLLLAGGGLALLVVMGVWPWIPVLWSNWPGLHLISWGLSSFPLLLQPWWMPLDPLEAGEFSRELPLEVEQDDEEALVLLVRSGELATHLALRNRISPQPVPGNGGERATGLSPFRGRGVWILVQLGALTGIFSFLISR